MTWTMSLKVRFFDVPIVDVAAGDAIEMRRVEKSVASERANRTWIGRRLPIDAASESDYQSVTGPPNAIALRIVRVQLNAMMYARPIRLLKGYRTMKISSTLMMSL